MTAKRFVKFNITANDDYTIQNGVKDSVTGEWYHTIDNENAKRLCGLLNELHEENQRLKKQIHELITGIQETSKMSADAVTKQWRSEI